MRILFYVFFILTFSCKSEKSKDADQNVVEQKEVISSDQKKDDVVTLKKDSPSKENIKKKEDVVVKGNITTVDRSFEEISLIEDGISIDIKYATKDNFTKKQIYPCGKCYLRPEAAKKIMEAQNILQTKYKLGLKMFDCYRPRPAQQRLWDVVPNPDYVTPPEKGSMHNRGLAVDLTLIDQNGKELDMGTPYDFFGKEAHTDNLNLPKKVLENRALLTTVMKSVGFQGIRTEWWHFSITSSSELSDWEWDCN